MSVWFRLERIEEELSRRGSPFGRRTHDSYGRLLDGLRAPWNFGLDTRVQRLRRALRDSRYVAESLIKERLAGIDLGIVWGTLIETCEDVALYYGASVVAGAAVGGVAGAFAGGVGAIPGAAAGAATGATVGGWLLALLGLKATVEGLVDAVPAALGYYERGFRAAWGPTPRERMSPTSYLLSPTGVQGAAFQFGHGHVLLLIAMLSALLAYLSRGRERGAALQEIRGSAKLGPKVADWLVHNEGRLQAHPALQPRPARAGGSAGHEPPPPPPPRRPRGEEEPSGPRPMRQARVPCFKAEGLQRAQVPEFDRQLAGQERGVNGMSVQEYLDGRAAFDTGLNARDPGVAKKAREAYEEKLQFGLSDEFRNAGLSARTADEKAALQAAEKMKTLAALHNPDMVAGGKDVINGFGDRNVNSRIGAQWRSRVGELDKAANGVPVSERPHTRMNAKLERCK